MGKSSNEKENKLSGSNIIVKVITIVLAIVLLLVLSFYAIMDGIVNLIFNFAVDLAKLGVDIVKEYFEEVILQEKFQGTLRIYKISEGVIAQVQENLESSGIDAEACGLTPVRIRKMLMAEEISSSLNQTLCIATVTEKEILENVKQKDKYKNVNSLDDFKNSAKAKNSKDVWTDEYDYTLYYDSEIFFYFNDEDNIFGEGANQWYMGAMGVITIMDHKNEASMVHGTREDFEKQKSDLENAIKSWIEGDDDFAENELKSIYTDGASDEEIIVWNIVEKQQIYNYDFENTKNNISLKEVGKDENSTFEFKEQVINIAEGLNTDEFVISMELMVDLLDMTGSGEFLETFIDYALSDLEVTARLYQTTEVQTEYNKEKFNIPDGFVLEVYDFIDVGNSNASDFGNDNFEAYGDIVYKREYPGIKFETVPELLEKKDINYNGNFKETQVLSADETKKYLKEKMGTGASTVVDLVGRLDNLLEGSRIYTTIKDELKEFIENNQEIFSFLEGALSGLADGADGFVELLIDGLLGDLELEIPIYYAVWPLEDCLKLAYDPGSGFTLGEIVVEEKTKTRIRETSCEVALDNIKTWYGDFNYSEPEKIKQYFLAVEGEDEVEITKDTYNNFGYSDLEANGNEKSSAGRLRIHSSYSLAGQYSMGNDVKYHSALDGGTDMIDEIFERQTGKNSYENKDIYNDWTTNGLAQIAEIDLGKFNEKFTGNSGAGKGADFVYLKYTAEKIEKYKETTKIKRETLNRNSIQRTTVENSMKNKLERFLGLLKNDTGEIPNPPGSKRFDENGIVVLYGDIYKGKIPAGDLLLDNGALMLFDLLESNTSTETLVNVFKYLAYLYTEVDYGITDPAQLAYLFSMGSYSGSDFIVNTGMSSKDIVLSEEQLKEVIEKTYSGNAKSNLLGCVNDFMYIQENYKVNAVFAMAVTIIESSGGTDWAAIDSSTYNWMSVTGSYKGNSYRNPASSNPRTWRVYSNFNEATRDFGDLIANGSYYFKAGKYSVKDIAPTYCDEDWGNRIISEMTKMYNKIGINLNAGGIEGVAGNVTTFTVGSRTYKNYKQIEEVYRKIPLANYTGTNLYDSGCAVTSVAIIASGFGQNVDPIAVNNYESQKRTTAHDQVVSHYTGMKCTWVYSDIKNGVINQLRSGYPVMVHVGANNGTFATSRGHFFTILSISEDGNSIYVSNPSSRRDGIKTGWIRTSVLNEAAFDKYLKMEAR